MVLYLLLAAFLAASVAPAFAQARGAFSILCNVTGARIYLNGKLAGLYDSIIQGGNGAEDGPPLGAEAPHRG